MQARVSLVPDIPVPGEAAPAFVLPQAMGLGAWSLSAQRGKQRVLVAFLGRLSSRRGAEALAAWLAVRLALQAARVELALVALDPLPELKARARSFPLGAIVLSDPDGKAGLPYGAWAPLYPRRAILVDGSGRVRLVQAGKPRPELFFTFLDGLRGDLAPPVVGAEAPGLGDEP